MQERESFNNSALTFSDFKPEVSTLNLPSHLHFSSGLSTSLCLPNVLVHLDRKFFGEAASLTSHMCTATGITKALVHASLPYYLHGLGEGEACTVHDIKTF